MRRYTVQRNLSTITTLRDMNLSMHVAGLRKQVVFNTGLTGHASCASPLFAWVVIIDRFDGNYQMEGQWCKLWTLRCTHHQAERGCLYLNIQALQSRKNNIRLHQQNSKKNIHAALTTWLF